MVISVLRTTIPDPDGCDPYAELLAPITDERVRAKARQAIARIVRLSAEYVALVAGHDQLMAEFEANEHALMDQRPGLARVSYELRAAQLDRQLTGLEWQMQLLEVQLGWAR